MRQRHASGIKGLDGYVVGLEDEPVESSTVEIEQAATTDAQGRATLQIPVQDVSAPRPTEARVTLRVAETGGRAVERSVTLPILPKGPVVAVQKELRRAAWAKAPMQPSMWLSPNPTGRASPTAMSCGASTRSNAATNGTIPTGAGDTSLSKPRAA